MSYCVNIKTDKRPQPKEVFQKFIERGGSIIITSNNYPCLRFGTLNKALRGIEVNEEEDGMEVRICSGANVADYHLFVVAIDVLLEITDATAYTDDDEMVTNPYQTFHDEWIQKQMESSWNVIKILAKNSGTAIVMYGLFQPFCVGPRLLKSFGVSLYSDYNDEKDCFDKLTAYLVKIQWWLSKARDTHSRLALPNPDDPDAEPSGISLIAMKNNEYKKFDFVSYAPFLAITNLDTDEAVIIHFEDFRKAVDEDDHFSCVDEWQMRTCCGEPTVEEIQRIMERAKRYVPKNLHYRPTYPGSGYDERQKTFVLMWNPETSDITLNEHIRSIRNMFENDFSRRVHEWKEAQMGDRFYIVRVGDGNTGIVMSGIFGSQPYMSESRNAKGRRAHIIDLKPNMILNPETAPMLTTEDLENTILNFMWRGGYSGRLLTKEQAKLLEALFAGYMKTIKDKDDGINICITRKL